MKVPCTKVFFSFAARLFKDAATKINVPGMIVDILDAALNLDTAVYGQIPSAPSIVPSTKT